MFSTCKKIVSLGSFVLTLSFAVGVQAQSPQGTSFTYQGRLTQSGEPANGTADFQFSLFDAPVAGGNMVGNTYQINGVNVVDGLFTVSINFQDEFNGDARWMEIAVRSPAGSGAFTTLSPRTRVSAAPYALKVPGVDGHALHAVDGSPTNSVYVGVDGRVGIGTTAPFSAVLDVEGDVRVNNFDLFLRDLNHTDNGLGYYGPSKTFDGVAVDGPVLYGSSGGALGSKASGTEKVALTWLDNGNVGIGTTTPDVKFNVVGHTRFDGDVHLNSEFISVQGILTVVDRATFADTVDFIGSVDFNNTTTMNGNATVNADFLVNGMTTTNVLRITGGSDIAEPYDIVAAGDIIPQPGMVVSIDSAQLGKMRVADSAYDRTVAGIISGAGGVNPGLTLTQDGTVADGELPVANVGRVWCWCDADANGPIVAGDLLTTADTAGHAMKVTDHARSQGAIIGKAMSSLESGRGLVLVLVSLQ